MNDSTLEQDLQELLARTKKCYEEVMNGFISASDWNDEQEWEELPCNDGKAEAKVIFSTIYRHALLQLSWEGKDGVSCADACVSYSNDTAPSWDMSIVEKGFEGEAIYMLYELVSGLNEEA